MSFVEKIKKKYHVRDKNYSYYDIKDIYFSYWSADWSHLHSNLFIEIEKIEKDVTNYKIELIISNEITIIKKFSFVLFRENKNLKCKGLDSLYGSKKIDLIEKINSLHGFLGINNTCLYEIMEIILEGEIIEIILTDIGLRNRKYEIVEDFKRELKKNNKDFYSRICNYMFETDINQIALSVCLHRERISDELLELININSYYEVLTLINIDMNNKNIVNKILNKINHYDIPDYFSDNYDSNIFDLYVSNLIENNNFITLSGIIDLYSKSNSNSVKLNIKKLFLKRYTPDNIVRDFEYHINKLKIDDQHNLFTEYYNLINDNNLINKSKKDYLKAIINSVKNEKTLTVIYSKIIAIDLNEVNYLMNLSIEKGQEFYMFEMEFKEILDSNLDISIKKKCIDRWNAKGRLTEKINLVLEQYNLVVQLEGF